MPKSRLAKLFGQIIVGYSTPDPDPVDVNENKAGGQGLHLGKYWLNNIVMLP